MKRTMNKKKPGLAGSLLLSIVVILSTAGPSIAGPEVGSPAIDFTLPDHAGVDRSLSDYEGKVIVLALLTPS